MSTTGRRIALPLLAVLLGALVLGGVGMYLYDHARRDRIASGVRIGGVDVGGLGAAAARAKLERDVGARLGRPVTVHSQGHTWRITPREAALRVDVNGMVTEAVAVSRQGSIFSRTTRDLFGGSLHREIPLQQSYSHAAVRAFTARVRLALDLPPRDATVRPGAGGLEEVPSRTGLGVNGSLLGARVEHALTGLGSSSVEVPLRSVRPAVSTGDLAARYPAYIVIDRGSFTLRFYHDLRLAVSYPIAVGMQGLETPPGLYHIQWKQVNPPWYVPKSAWAGALAGKVIPPGPQDPLKARFMSFDGGAGIHGIDPSEYSSIGHDASHGCVRMRIPDVIALYSRTPVGTPVYII
ncbi:MAG TPA: L,D-transpeptidase family protein [Solirubrobacteraceae bacterium]|jgi:lipoprotein-anchoring transpeptidase ErfK/SrfK|nr:L,D-transpeptidase family protein [Solirubrobacteraceae bacterium]